MSKQAESFLFHVMAGRDPAITMKLRQIPGSSPGMTSGAGGSVVAGGAALSAP